MPIEILKGNDAVEIMKKNVNSTWPARGSEQNRVEPFALPGFEPSFSIEPGEKIFTIGSCFARNVENALIDRGFEIPSRDALRADPEFAAIGPNILNNYGVPSIYNEVMWGLGLKEFVQEENFFPMGEDKYVDIHLNQSLRPASLRTVATRRAAIRQAYSRIRECKVVVITLGLTECWYDTRTGMYVNTPPRRKLIRDFPDRFELHVLKLSETMEFLTKTIEAIRTHGRPDVRVIVTVSPVPLTATHRSVDVMVANMYSKSVLRVAAEEVVAAYDFVDYFPSFESVLISQRDRVWEDDLVHIKKPVIDLNVSRMIARYSASPHADSDETPEELLARLSRPDVKPAEVFGALENRMGDLKGNVELALLFCDSACRIRRFEAARKALADLPSDADPERMAWVRAQIAVSDGDHETVVASLTPFKQRFQRRVVFWRYLVPSVAAGGDVKAFKDTITEWAKVFPHAAEPYRLGAKHLAAMGALRDAEYMFRKAIAMAGDDDASPLELDYAEFLADQGKIMMGRNVLDNFKPANPHHAARLEELKLRLNMK